MNWTKIKNILLDFLLVMNIFLIIILSISTHSKLSIPEKVVNSSISLLNKSGFQISENDFPDKYYMLPDYTAKFYTASELSGLFFKKQTAFRTTENSLVATNDDATLTISNNRFVYESGTAPDGKQNPSTIKRKLEKVGINMSGAVYDEKEGCFYRMFNKANLFNMSIEAKLDKDGNLCYVSGYWPKDLIAGERKTFSFLECTVKLKDYFPEGGKINKIELGFSLVSGGGEKYLFTPAWRVNVGGELKIIE